MTNKENMVAHPYRKNPGSREAQAKLRAERNATRGQQVWDGKAWIRVNPTQQGS